MAVDLRTSALLFPGQGSQYVGMGQALAKENPLAAQAFARADSILGFALSRLCWEGPADDLNDTAFTQPAIFTHSIAILQVLQARFPGFRAAAAAGHSMGEISALVAGGALSFEDGLALVRERGLAMKQAGELLPGGMAAVIGLDLEQAEAACAQAAERTRAVIGVANDNCPGQVVISGDEAGLLAAMELLKQSGARKVMRLAVSIAAHSPLMIPAQERFSRAVRQTQLHQADLPVYGNVEAAPLQSAASIEQDLRNQLTMRVRWTETIHNLAAAGVTAFLEIGPGTVLTGLAKRIEPGLQALALDGTDPGAALG
ncbi:MAG: ACP S-malonyltransferase [Anaerolineales bacterium]|nr:ACP S-malonyltransferase [Anaerolineales bacterium]